MIKCFRWILLLLAFSPILISGSAGSSSDYLQERRDALIHVNQIRSGLSLEPLGTFDLLETAVQNYTVDLAGVIGSLNDTCRHKTLNGDYSWTYAERLGIYGSAGEVVACGIPSGRAAVEAWMGSSGHRGILTGNYNIAAFGRWETQSTWPVWVGLFMYVDPTHYPIYIPGKVTTPSPTFELPSTTPTATPTPSSVPTATPIPLPTLTSTPGPTVYPTPVPTPSYARRGIAWADFLIPGAREAFDTLCAIPGIRCWYYR